MEAEKEEQGPSTWQILSDDILLKILCYLPAMTLVKVARVCKTWYRVAFDEILWKDLFYSRWKIARSMPMAPGKVSWVKEYKRLYYHTPAVESQVLRSHTDEVLHVSFSHNGHMFATSSRDGFIKVWDNSNPSSIKHQADMSRYNWIYTTFSQFNENDKLLLVSGVLEETYDGIGEIVIFSLQENFEMLSRVTNTPFDVYGTWYNNDCFLSGNFSWTGSEITCSTILLNKACQNRESAKDSMFIDLFHFRNENDDFVKSIMIADVVKDGTCYHHKASSWTTQVAELSTMQVKDRTSQFVHSVAAELGQISSDKYSNHPSKRRIFTTSASEKSCSSDNHEIALDPCMRNYESDFDAGTDANDSSSNTSSIDFESLNSENAREIYSHSFSFKATLDLKSTASEMEDKFASTSISDYSLINISCDIQTGHFDLIRERQTVYNKPCFNDRQGKALDINATKHCQATATVDNTVHVLSFPSDSDIQENALYSVNPADLASSNEILSEASTQDETLNNGNGLDVSVTPKLFDPVSEGDIHNNGSFENKVNTFVPSVNKNKSVSSCITERMTSSNITDKYLIFKRGSGSRIPHKIEIKLIRAKKYFSHVTKQLITDDPDNLHSVEVDDSDAIDYSFDMHGHIIGMCLSPDHSGAEDTHGYLWDRHYGICVNKFQHSDIVNSAVFNPADPEMLVTASDDHAIKVWRSLNREKELRTTAARAAREVGDALTGKQ